MDRPQLVTLVRDKGPAFALDIGVNFVAPYFIYSWLSPTHGDVTALLASSMPPILWSLVEFIRARRVDAMSVLVLAGIALSLIALVGGGGARWLQLREKLVTGIIGLAFLGSAAIGKPLIYLIARAGLARKGPSAELTEFEGLRGKSGFRRTMTLMTVVWGVALLIDVAVSVVLVFALAIKHYLILSPIVGYGILGATSLWTFWYARRAERRGKAAALARAAAGDPASDDGGPESAPRAIRP